MLRPLQDDDLEMVLNWRNAPEVRRNMYTTHEITMDEHMAWYDRIKNDPSQQILVFQDGDNPLGIVNFTGLNKDKKTGFWGFYAGLSAPKGTGLKMEYEALEYAFEKLGLHKLNCEVIAFNKAVVNMHKKVGFVEEGCFRDYHYDGENYHDVIRLGMLSSEWQECKSGLADRISKLSENG